MTHRHAARNLTIILLWFVAFSFTLVLQGCFGWERPQPAATELSLEEQVGTFQSLEHFGENQATKAAARTEIAQVTVQVQATLQAGIDCGQKIRQELQSGDISSLKPGASLVRCNLSNLDLSGLDLSNTDLSRADLSGANLSNTRLSYARLEAAKLIGADLSEAILTHAVLDSADLTGARLNNADLRHASLVYTNLTNAKLNYADLSNAAMAYTNLKDAQLNQTNLTHAFNETIYMKGAQLTGVVFPGSSPDPLPTPIEQREVLIPAGSFEVFCDQKLGGIFECTNQQEENPEIYLNDFFIDVYETTNWMYQECERAGICTAPDRTSSHTRPLYYGYPAFVNYPVVHVGLAQAEQYCAWAGKRLPTEAEWEKAARGPKMQLYPWGDSSPTCSLSNFWGLPDGCVGDTAAVGSYPAGASMYGVMDMSGNVWEWVNSQRTWANYYQNDSYIVRGGSWNNSPIPLQSTHRSRASIVISNYGYGFRCARTP